MPQQLSIETALTGRQNVELFARLYAVPRAERTELFTRMVRPALWLLIFGQTQSALFISMFYGIQIIWDRDTGILAKPMVTRPRG